VLVLLCCCESGDDVILNDQLNAPDFTLYTIEKEDYTLSQLKGKVVVLYFFESKNCLSCLASMPDIEGQLVEPFRDLNNYLVLALDVSDGNDEVVRYFRTISGISFPVLKNASITASVFDTASDRIIVVDPTGRISFRGNRPVLNDIESALKAIQHDLKQLNN